MTNAWTNKHERMASLAFHEASKAERPYQHGCVLTRGKKVISRGHNNHRTYSKDGLISNTSCGCHAEVDALRRVYTKRLRSQGERRTLKVA